MPAKPPRGKEAGKAFVPAAERCQGQAGLSPNPAPQAWPQSLPSLLRPSAWACLYYTGGCKALELPRALGGLLSPWLWPLLLLSGSAGYALLRPPPLRPPGLLLSWVSCEQSLRLLWRPWRREEDRTEGPSLLECSDSRGPETRPVGAQLPLPGPAPPPPACTHSPLPGGFLGQ